jgi:1,4-dihydroxy-2-naphthoate octaprenyltransferase
VTYGSGQPGRSGGANRELASVLLISVGFFVVLLAAWFTDPRLAVALFGLGLTATGVFFGFERW